MYIKYPGAQRKKENKKKKTLERVPVFAVKHPTYFCISRKSSHVLAITSNWQVPKCRCCSLVHKQTLTAKKK